MLKKMLGSILIVFVSIIILQQKNINAPAAIRIDREVYAVGGDTTYQLQQLLDYNKYGYYNLTVRIPAGKYNLTKELRIYSNTTIIADKDAVLMKNHQKGAMIANDLTNDKGGYSTTENIQIIGGVWDSKNIALGDQGTESLRFIHATNVTVKDATICNVPDGSHLITFAGVKNGTIDNCHLYGYYGTTEKEAIHLDIVHDSIMVPSMQKASLLYDDTACDGITIKNSEITNYPRAIGAHTSVKGVYHKNIIISDNYIHDVQEAAVKAYNFVNLTIDHNRMEHVGLGILVYTYLSNGAYHYKEALNTTVKEALPNNYNIKITKNTLKDITRVQAKGITKWGDAIRIIGINNRKLNGVMIDNNDISNIERYGIFVQMAPKCQVTNNTFELTEKTGIYLISGCDASTIKYNTISSSNYYGIFLNGVKNSFVLNNKVSNTAKYAIYLAKKSNGSSVILNDLLNVGKMNSKEGGIGVSESQKVKILQNTITNAAKNGVFVYNQSMYCSIKQNSIRQAGENGISVNSNSNYAIIKSNSIIGNDDNNSFDRGIFVYQSKKATIGDNDISNCKVNQKLY